ncbi:hypothetical protein ACE198_05045 [Neobacillus sp. KR4-4]|uniref:hypothetical protein n=1 Tax=Neobacillus sp. KR4-4 TaxID=3344872 RepID=UPI0035C9E92C
MDFQELSLGNIYDVKNNQDLIEMLYCSISEMMEFILTKVENHELAQNILTPQFSDINNDITFGHKELIDTDTPGELKKVYEILVPIYDEQKREHYKKKPFRLPETGKFVQSNAKLIIKPLGLVEVQFWGAQLSRMEKDTRYLAPFNTYKCSDYWYYDYEKQQYKMVPEDKVEKAKFDLRKGKKLSELEFEDTKVKIFMEREAILEVALKRIKGYAEEYHDLFDIFQLDRFNAKWHYKIETIQEKAVMKNSKIILDPTGNIITIDPTITDIRNYQNRYLEFIRTHLSKWLKIKLIFSTISVREYNAIVNDSGKIHKNNLKEIDRLSLKMLQLESDLKKLENALIAQNLDTSITWSNIPNNLDSDIGIIKNRCVKCLEEVVKFTEARSESGLETSDPQKGYIKINSKRSEVFPNIAEIERRRSLTNHFFSVENEQAYIKNLLSFLNKAVL